MTDNSQLENQDRRKILSYIGAIAALIPHFNNKTDGYYSQKPGDISNILDEFRAQVVSYWEEIDSISSEAHIAHDLSIEIDTKATFEELIRRSRCSLSTIDNFCDSVREEEMIEKHFESLCLGIPNAVTHLTIYLLQMHIKHLEACIEIDPLNKDNLTQIEHLKKELVGLAKNASYFD